MSCCYNCFKEINDERICPFCGFDSAAERAKYPFALPCGTVLCGRYIVGRVLGQGGFGITYIAQDYHSKNPVAIKEYYPEILVTRTGTTVTTFSGEREESFFYGKDCFLSEAKTLSQFIGNPNIVRVYSYFEENNTAYFAMEYIGGVSLMQYLKDQGGRIGFEEAERILLPIMDALSAVHAKGIIHRDISPDNIYLTRDGTVKLIDFGAARYSMGDRSRSLDVVLKHGYAPKEQYTRRGRQGIYTDVYAFAATFYRSITGHVPPDAIERMEEDDLVAPSVLRTALPAQAEEAIMKALSLSPAERYQTMAQFKAELTAGDVGRPVGHTPVPEPLILSGASNDPPFRPVPPVTATPVMENAPPVPMAAADILPQYEEPQYDAPAPVNLANKKKILLSVLLLLAVIITIILIVVFAGSGGSSSDSDSASGSERRHRTSSYDELW